MWVVVEALLNEDSEVQARYVRAQGPFLLKERAEAYRKYCETMPSDGLNVFLVVEVKKPSDI